MSRSKRRSQHREPQLPSEAEFQSILAEANQGNRQAIEQLKQLLDEQPHIWQHVGNMGQQAEDRLVAHIAKGNSLVQESLRRELAVMREELLGGKPTRMERILVDRIVMCWLQQQYIDIMYPTTDGLAGPAARLVMQQRESAQRLLTSAQNALQTYRKLAPPKLKLAEATIPFPKDKISQGA